MTTPEQSSSAGPGDQAGAPPGAPHESAPPTIDELSFPPLAGRPRVIRAELSQDRGWKSHVEIVLEREGRQAEIRRDAIGEEIALLRCAAESTLDALNELLGGPPRFALVGAKRVVAFDSAVILACVRTLGGRPRKLIGCVPFTEDPVLAVARAVLHATNRIVEALPNAPGSSRGTEAGATRDGEADEIPDRTGVDETGTAVEMDVEMDPEIDDPESDAETPTA